MPADPSLASGSTLSLFQSFDDLLSGTNGAGIDRATLVDVAFERGRLLLQARAGAGKSVLIRVLAETQSSLDREIRVIPLASGLMGQSQEEIEEWLFSELAEMRRVKLLLCLDGLDEIPLEVGQRLLRAIEEVTRTATSSAILVSDRLGRRVIRESRWGLVGLTSSLDHSQSAGQPHPSNVVPSEASQIPVHDLGLTLKQRLTGMPSNAADIDVLASALLENLPNNGLSRLMDRSWLESTTSRKYIELLEANGVLWAEGSDQLQFPHVLFSAYLAARALAKRPEDWNSYWFSLVTARGSNFEALGFLLQLVGDDQVDPLVRKVDEWNFYASMYVLSEDFQSACRASPSLRTALLLLMGRRRFSAVPSTRIQTEDALRLHGGPLAQRLLSADSLEELVAIALEQDFADGWWVAWRHLFVRPPGAEARISDIEALGSDDGVLGWTAANVLLALDIEPSLQTQIANLAKASPNENVRWRAVHVLGSLSSSDAWEVCFDAFTLDSSSWVRNGALRSMILVTSRLNKQDERTQAFLRLGELSENILDNPKWSREIERAVQVADRPAGWSDSVAILLEDLWAEADSVEDQDRWRTLSASLRTPWQGASELGSGS